MTQPRRKDMERALRLYKDERWEEARQLCHRILQSNPDHSQSHAIIGLILQKKNKHQEALEHFRKAIVGNSGEPANHFNMGVSFLALKQYNEAINAFEQTCKLAPRYAPARINLGVVFLDLREYDRALESLGEAIRLDPNHKAAHLNIGLAYFNLGDTERALHHYRQGLAITPDDPVLLQNLGNLLNYVGHSEAAVPYLEKAVALRPDYAKAYSNLANAHLALGNIKLAGSFYGEAMRWDHENVVAHSNFLMSQHYDEQNTPQFVFSAHLEWARRHVKRLAEPRILVHNFSSDKRLRLGYFSPDFRRHSVAFFIEPILAAHDKNEFNVFCYSNTQRPDHITERLKNIDQIAWRDITALNDDQAAEQIRNDGIDILVDLAGHSSHNRLSLFALRPAPLQITYLGYPDTTGLATIDYRLTDEFADPPGLSDTLHTETLYRLPGGFLCYRPPDNCPSLSPLPSQSGRSITFGTFNILSKITDEMIQVWAKILQEVPGSKFLLKSRCLEGETAAKMCDRFQRYGVERERVQCHGFTSTLEEHLDMYRKVDICLDTYPYSGTTTTCEALWMGRPVVTLCGQTHASRVGCSILTRLELGKLIATTPDEYLAISIRLAGNRDELGTIHSSLRQVMKNKGLIDSVDFTHMLEDSYRRMWEKLKD